MIPNDNKEINPFDIRKQYIDSMNMYQFVNDNPVIGVDPDGLLPMPLKFEENKTNTICCKIRKKHTRIICGPYFCTTYSHTTCTQESPSGIVGSNPRQACKCYYLHRPNVEVYDAYAHENGCCWCNLQVKINLWAKRGMRGHFKLIVKCDDKKINFGAHVYPDASGGWWNVFFPPGSSTTVDVGGTEDRGFVPIKSCKISCDQAKTAKDYLWEMPYNFYLFGHSCASFARSIGDVLCEGCP